MNTLHWKTPGTFFLLFFISLHLCFADSIKSPDKQIVLNFELQNVNGLENCPVYSVTFRGQPILDQSGLGFTLGDGSTLIDQFQVVSKESENYDDTWKPVYGERSEIRNNYNELVVELYRVSSPRCTLELIFRCYDSGVAIRYRLVEGEFADYEITINSEHTEFRFPDDHKAWITTYPQGKYTEKPISEMGSGVCRPYHLL